MMKIIDTHTYLGDGVHISQTEDELLRRMDEAGIACAVACSVDRFLAVENRDGNNSIIRAVRRHPDRLAGMASANPWFGQAAVDELKRAFDGGLAGLFLYPNYQGYRLCDHIADPLVETAADYGVPVYAHTGTAGIAEPFHVVELARRFPATSFVMGHAGSSDYGEDAVRALEFADNIWLETSRNGPANFGLWKVRNIMDRVLFGSGSPEYIPEIEIETLREVFTEPDEQALLFERNAGTVFGDFISV